MSHQHSTMWNRMWSRIASSIIKSELDLEERRRRIYFVFCLVISIPVLLAFAIRDIAKRDTIEAIFCLFLSASLIASLVSLKYATNGTKIFRANFGLVFCLLLYYVITGGSDGSWFLWSYIFPLVAFFLFGRREGALWVLVFFAFANAIMWMPTVFGAFIYAMGYRIRFPISFLLVAGLSYAFERYRQQFYERLKEEQNNLLIQKQNLEEAVEETKTANSALTEANMLLQQEMAERRRAEEAYRSVVYNSLQGLLIAQDFRIVFANPAISEITGYSVEELTSLSPEKFKALIYPDDQVLVWGRMQERLAGGSVTQQYEMRIMHKDGSVRWLELYANLADYNGKPAVQVALMDVTQRKQWEEALQRSELQYRSTIDSMSDAIHVVDKNLRFVLFNAAFREWCRKLGVSADIIGQRLPELFPFLPDHISGEYQKVLHTGKSLITEEGNRLDDREIISETLKIPIQEFCEWYQTAMGSQSIGFTS